jgi:hypothetical protein
MELRALQWYFPALGNAQQGDTTFAPLLGNETKLMFSLGEWATVLIKV